MIGIPKRHFRVCTQVPLVNAKNAKMQKCKKKKKTESKLHIFLALAQ
jgi:hypothetical protein